MWVEVDPPLLGEDGVGELGDLVLAPRFVGDTAFPISAWPLHVYVCRIIDPAITQSLTITAPDQLQLLFWMEAYRAREDAEAEVEKHLIRYPRPDGAFDTMDTTFPHAYHIRELGELPVSESLPRYYYPGASRKGGRDGVLLEVRPERGTPWVGVFAFGQFPRTGPAGIFTTPHPHRLCVVTRGEGCFVRADDPTDWEPVSVTPITHVVPVRNHGLLLFADFTDLLAYGADGVRWRTDRLVLDGLRITEISGPFVLGEGSAPDGTVGFRVELATGRREGGVGLQ